MATTTDTDTETVAEERPAEGLVGHGNHPSEGQYWKIFFLLFGITAVEIGLYYFNIPGVNFNNGVLLLLAAAKFTVVVGYFMHLKFDSRILRRLFVTGLALAAVVYMGYLLTMGVFLKQPSERQHAPTTSQS